MSTEPSTQHSQASPELSRLADAFVKLAASNQEREKEARGRVTHFILAAAGIAITMSGTLLFPIAGKEQALASPQFQVFVSSLRPDMEAAYAKLQSARSGLPNSESFKTKFTTTQGELAQRLIDTDEASMYLMSIHARIVIFVESLSRDFQQQSLGAIKSSEGYSREISWMTDSVENLKTCNDEIATRLKLMKAGVEPNASSAAVTDVLVQTTTAIKDIWKGTEKNIACLRSSEELVAHVGTLVNLHDQGVSEFNDAASKQSAWIKLSSAIGAILIYAFGRTALRWLLANWKMKPNLPS